MNSIGSLAHMYGITRPQLCRAQGLGLNVARTIRTK